LAEGQAICLRYYAYSNASGLSYDDSGSLVVSGTNLWTIGLKQLISSKYGSSEAQLLLEGKILKDDSKLYINGSIPTSGTLKIGLGSPVTEWFRVLSEGVDNGPMVNGDAVYKKLFMRFLPTGSLDNE